MDTNLANVTTNVVVIKPKIMVKSLFVLAVLLRGLSAMSVDSHQVASGSDDYASVS